MKRIKAALAISCLTAPLGFFCGIAGITVALLGLINEGVTICYVGLALLIIAWLAWKETK